MMELKDTVDLMLSEDYKERLKAEFHQTRIRGERLQKTLREHEAGILEFIPNCSWDLLHRQFEAMSSYLKTLVLRASEERINLWDEAENTGGRG